jgi:hypothetical protein
LTETATATSETTTAATCTSVGSAKYTAEFSDSRFATQTKDVEIPMAAHTLTSHAAKAATCTEAGNSAYYQCSVCKKYFSDAAGTTVIEENSWVIGALGHNYGEWTETKPATETEAGEKTRTCSRCGDVEKETIPPTSVHVHKLTAHPAVEATCTATGNSAYWVCDQGDKPCGKYFSDAEGKTEITKDSWVIKALGHKWGEWKVTKAATETEEGIETRTCDRCKATETRKIDKKSPSTPGTTPADKSTTADPSKDPNHMGIDGTAFSQGASLAAVEKAILSLPNDNDPAGTEFGKLTLRSPKQTKSSIKLSWTKVPNAKKYIIYANACGKTNKSKKLAEVTGNSKNIKNVAGKKLKKGKYYKFIVVAVDGSNMVVTTSKIIHVATKGGKVGNNKSVSVKKSVINKAKKLKAGKSLKVNAKAVAQSKKLKVKKHVAVRYESTDTSIATVTKKGVIKGKKKGKCNIYAYAQNGVFKKIKVVVK